MTIDEGTCDAHPPFLTNTVIYVTVAAFAAYSSLWVMEAFPSKFAIKLGKLHWIHHIAVWVTYLLFATWRDHNIITISFAGLYGIMMDAFALADFFQLARYFSDSTRKKYLYFRIFFYIKCIQYPLYVILPYAWVIYIKLSGCFSLSGFISVCVIIFVFGAPDILILFTQMRSIVLHYKKKVEQEEQGDKSTTASTDIASANSSTDKSADKSTVQTSLEDMENGTQSTS